MTLDDSVSDWAAAAEREAGDLIRLRRAIHTQPELGLD